jgi:hypothetical protein
MFVPQNCSTANNLDTQIFVYWRFVIIYIMGMIGGHFVCYTVNLENWIEMMLRGIVVHMPVCRP